MVMPSVRHRLFSNIGRLLLGGFPLGGCPCGVLGGPGCLGVPGALGGPWAPGVSALLGVPWVPVLVSLGTPLGDVYICAKLFFCSRS